jgi:3-methyladenine DNA glycosylase/8-oxoguanine DNA glycosylase
MLLTSSQPYIFRDVVFAHGWLRLAPFRWEEAAGVLRRIERLPSGRLVELAFSGPAALDTWLSVEVAPDGAAALAAADREALVARARWIFCLDEDLSAFHDFCAAQPGLRRAAERRQGRLLRSPTVFEELIKTLCCVNARWAQSVRMAERLVEHYGEPLPQDPARRAFPEPAALAATDPAQAQEHCRLGYRAARLVGIARAVAEGRLDLEALRDPALPADEITARLKALPGVGPYAAAHVLSLLGRHQHLPLDSWVRATVRQGWFEGRAASDREVAAAFDRFHPYQNLVYRLYDWDGANHGFRLQVEGEPPSP